MLSYNVINIVYYFLNVYADESSEETKKSENEKKNMPKERCSFVYCLFAWLAPQFVQHLTGLIFHTGTFSEPFRQSESE